MTKPALAEHLRVSIVTGSFCCYRSATLYHDHPVQAWPARCALLPTGLQKMHLSVGIETGAEP
ncbi:hypothetical protein BG841_02240 [Marinobacter sp. X15-166B]|nr:hypothetical protein BG841_02240 [Marinobacter sp. X15-166B]